MTKNSVLTASELRGNWGTLLLPIEADDAINWQLLEDELDYLLQSGLDGIYSNGTAGEFHNQSEWEFDRIQQLLAERCRSAGSRFQIGAAHPCPLTSLERVKRTRALQPDAFQVILPDWVAPNEKEQFVFLQKIAEAAEDIPLVLYHPPHAKAVLAPKDYERLQQAVPQLIGIKVAPANDAWYAAMRRHASNLSVFVPGHMLATGIREQVASGSYSNVACLNPRQAQGWWRLMQQDLPAAVAVEARLQQFMQETILPYKEAGYSNPALDKLLAAVGGWCATGTRLRWPYQWIAETEVLRLRQIAMKVIPEFVA